MIPWHPDTKIIQQQKWLWAIFKPCNVLSHPNHCHINPKSILQAHYDFEHEAYILPDNTKIYLLNRLDSPTSGIILLSTDVLLAQQIKNLFRQHQVHKVYWAIVKKTFPENSLIWQDFLKINKNINNVRSQCSSRAQGVFCKTKARLLKPINLPFSKLSLIQLEPLTGRTHQLRVQCAHHGFPILGDKTYGDFAFNKALKVKRLFLHAYAIRLNLPHFNFEATCVPDFEPYIKNA